MKYEKGHLVRNAKLGLGKVIGVSGSRVTVFFKDQKDNPKIIIATNGVLDIPAEQSDPWLDNLDLEAAKSGKVPKYTTHQGAIEKFLRKFPLGFYDPNYIGDAKKMTGERAYKWVAHELWNELLNRPEFDRLLDAHDYNGVVERALRGESKTNLLFVYEKAALRDAVKEPAAARSFASGLYDLIYGNDSFEQRFVRFSKVLETLPQPKSETLKWPIQTIFPFLALPAEHLFLKPEVTQEAARRRAFSLNYQPRPNWLTYSCLLRFGELLMKDLADLKPRDMIDIQSFLWVTADAYGEG